MTRLLLSGFIAAILAVTGAFAAEVFNPAYRVVFAGEKARELTQQCSRMAPGPITGTWTPTDADLDTLEPLLVPVLAQALAGRRFYVPAAEYFRQYGGLIIGGRRVIYLNAFHRSRLERRDGNGQIMPIPDTWRVHAMLVCDGGPAMFGVEYDPATKVFSHFAFNGT